LTKWKRTNGSEQTEANKRKRTNGRGQLTNAVFFGQSRTRSMDLRRKMQNGKTANSEKVGETVKAPAASKGVSTTSAFL
ncbi:hypothetical protein POVCU1_024840, partial [Plasmodium ovale curtisi]